MKNRTILPVRVDSHSMELQNAKYAQEASQILQKFASLNNEDFDGVGYMEVSDGIYTSKNLIKLDDDGKANIVTEKVHAPMVLLADNLSRVSYYRTTLCDDSIAQPEPLDSKDGFESNKDSWNYTIKTFDTSIPELKKEAQIGLASLQEMSSNDPAAINFGCKSEGECRFHENNFPVDERDLVSLVYNEDDQLVAASEYSIFVTDPLLSPLENETTAGAGIVMHTIYAIPEARGKLIGSTIAHMVADLVDDHCLSSEGFMGEVSNRAEKYDLHCTIDAYTIKGADFGERLIGEVEMITEDVLENHALPFNDFFGSVCE